MDILKANYKVGFLGAGQLARMSALRAFEMGFNVVSYSERKATEPLEKTTPLHYTGSFADVNAMIEFAEACDVITLENEFIDSQILEQVVEKSGTNLFPTVETFRLIENKFIEKQTFENAGIPVAPYRLVESAGDLSVFGDKHGWPFMLKSSKGGYDGYGNETVHNITEAVAAFKDLGGADGRSILAEAFVDFTKELAVQVARNEMGIEVYPCCETVQEKHICTAVLSPAPIEPSIREEAQKLALKATEAINGKGIFAFEFFLKEDHTLVLNESAPRPHNSGHYTIEGCVASQFENHVRAVAGLPLGSAQLRTGSVAMINLLGTHERPACVENAVQALGETDGHLHIYGKEQSRPGRKMGHYTLLGENQEEIYSRAKKITKLITI